MPKLLSVVTLARLGRWFGLAFVFAFGAALALVLHVNSGTERRLIAELVPRLLADNLKGSFSLEGIEEITSSSVVFREFTAKDPRGREVVRVARVRVRADLVGLAQNIVFGPRRLSIVIDEVELHDATTHVYDDEGDGIPSIADAFWPRTEGTGQGRPVRLAIRAIAINRVRGRGKVLSLPELDARVEGARGWLRVNDEGVDLSVGPFDLTFTGLLGVEAKGRGRLRLREPGWLRSSFDGTFGQIPVKGRFRLDDAELGLTLDVPAARPEDVRRLVPGYPLVDDVKLHAEFQGAPPALVGSARLDVGSGVVLANGTVGLSNGGSALLEVVARRVNVRSVVAGAPPTSLFFVSNLALSGTPEGLAVSVDADVEPSLLDEFLLPRFQLAGRFEGDRFSGRALLKEPGFPLHVDVVAKTDGVVDVTARARGFELARVPRLKRRIELDGKADLDVRARFEKGRVSGKVGLDLVGFRYQELGIGRATVSGTAEGPLDELRNVGIDAALSASALRYGDFQLSRLAATAVGSVTSPRVRLKADDTRGGTLTAEGVFGMRDDELRLETPKLEARREGLRATGQARLISLAARRGEVRELALEVDGSNAPRASNGTLSANLAFAPNHLELDARAKNLDLTVLGQLLGVAPSPVLGKLSLDSELVIARELTRGRLSAELEQATLGSFKDARARAEAKLEGSSLNFEAMASFDNLGELRARLEGELGGSALEARSFREMTGAAVLEVIRVDLGALSNVLDPAHTVVLKGEAGAELKLSRKSPGARPNAALIGYTEHLGFTLKRDPEPLKVDDVDLRFGLNVAGDSGETELNVKLVTGKELLATLTLDTQADLDALLGSPTSALAELRALPVAGKLRMEERRLDALPAPIRPPGVSGRVSLEANLAGRLLGPDVFARASVEDLELTSVPSENPLDVCASLGFSHEEQRLAGSGEVFLSRKDAGACSGRRFVRYAVDGRLVPKVGSTLGRLEGTLVAEFERLPLRALPGLGDEGLSGFASGTLSLARSDGPPVIFGRFDLRDARVHGVRIGDGNLDVRSNDRAIAASLRLERDATRLSANAFALLDTTEVVPTIDFNEPIGVRVDARKLDAVVLLPFTRDLFSELGGDVDAELDVLVSPRHSAASESEPRGGRVSGRATLHDGSLQLAGLGLRLNGVEMRARAEPQGKQTLITIDELEGRAGKRRERVRVQRGKVWLDGVELARAEGSIEATELPLLLEGVSQATATTRQGIAFELKRTEERMEVTFDVPYLSVALPQSSTRGVISLSENRSIEILQPLGEPKGSGGASKPWFLTFLLGKDVQITRSDLDLPLSGKAHVLLADKTEVTGDLELTPGGRIQVSGKTFVIDAGEVHFDTGDAKNPRMRVTATWRAPDGTIVLADVSGTFEQARLRLSSDPPRTEQEIYALLLGGSGSGGEGGDPTATGAGVGADLLGSLLVNTPLSHVEFRAGSEQLTDQRSYATYTAAVPISDKVWFEGSYKSLNTSDPSQERDAVSGTLDWRFRRNWSLRTEVGTIGTGLDLVWQYRY